ncbi:MAG: DUF4012 domain-containing protein [Patescibacteria group bacterium]|nr:DUF4012 domain-containing protein [Patescibacteria group bacterium]
MSWKRSGLQILLLIIKTASWLFVGAVILFLLFFLPTFNRFRSLYASEMSAKTAINQAVEAVKSKDFVIASQKAQEAQEHFFQAGEDLAIISAKPWMKNFFVYRNQIDDLTYLTKTGEILSRAVHNSAVLAGRFQEVISSSPSGDFNNLSKEKKSELFRLAKESVPELTGIKADINLASLNLEKIHQIGILLPVFSQIQDIDKKLIEVNYLLDSVVPLAELSTYFVGSPEAINFLILLQNNDELRPTGGFLGTYGILTVENGDIKNFFAEDIYHLDMPVKDTLNIVPPAPIKQYIKTDRWFLRDANWSPDWPTSARQIESTYRQEVILDNKKPVDFGGVIAINPALAADLIDLVGPIKVNNVIYKGDNFQELLQYEVEVSYVKQNISSWDRKEIINDIFAELKKRLTNLSYDNYPKILNLVNNNLAKKNIQVYLNHPTGQELIKSLGWAGEIKDSTGDYLMIVDANLAAFKSDAVVSKNWSYTLNQETDSLKATLNLKYQHNGQYDWRTTKYRSYTRILAPLGSTFISANGPETKVDVYDDTSLNKTIFGYFFTVDPQKSKEIILEYRLPNKIFEQAKNSSYNLYWQKQSGSRIESAVLNLPGEISRKINLETDQYIK